MLACGAASADGARTGNTLQWGGFNRVPLETSRSMRLNVLLRWSGGDYPPRSAAADPACLAVRAHVTVPDNAMAYAVLLGRDSWRNFPERKYVDINETATIATLVGSAGDSLATDPKSLRGLTRR